NKTSLGERILQNLHEVTLFFPSSCIQSCAACSSYYRQMNHCTTCHEDALKIEDYIHLLHQFQVCGIQRVNLLAGGNPLQNRYTRNLSIDFTGSTFKKHLYLEYNFLNNEYIEFAQQTNSILEILVHSGDLNNQLAESMQKYQHDMVRWNLIVSAETDLEQLDRLILPENILIQIRPFYNGSNYNFFHDFVFFDLQDILVEPIDRKTIFRHKVLNDNFFGKLTIFPSGEVFANVNCSTIGNIQKSSLKELVYKELTELETWLKVRSKETPCKQCINKDLCPSISNYELVIGKNNLCNIQHR
ncbi:TIGR04150 pseudo-rSAM protein, partial [Bacteroides cellulosilyticus]